MCQEFIPRLGGNHAQLFVHNKYTILCAINIQFLCAINIDGSVTPQFVNLNFPWSNSSAAKSLHTCMYSLSTSVV